METGEADSGQTMKCIAGLIEQFILRVWRKQNTPGYFKFVPYC